MKIHITIALALLSIIFSSCEKKCRRKDDKLTITKAEYNGSLKLDGYYWTLSSDGYDVFIFYKNGSIVRTHPENLQQFESAIPKASYKESKYGWGVFNVENGKQITIESWRTGVCEYPVFAYSGSILNDSMFIVNEFYRVINKENYERRNDTFYFKETASKPDSIQPYL